MRERWIRPPLETTDARRDFVDFVALCGLPVDAYEVQADSEQTCVTVTTQAGRQTDAEPLLSRAYLLAAAGRRAAPTVLLDQLDVPSTRRPGGSEQFLAVQPGLFAGRRPLVELLRRLDDVFLDLALAQGADELMAPHLITWEALRRAGYSTAFPEHLTACYAVRRDLDAIDRLAAAASPGEASAVMEPQDLVLAPAACYHVYPLLEHSVVDQARLVTLLAQCTRREAVWTQRPIRFWSFRMRELVFVGTASGARDFRERQLELLTSLAKQLALPCRLMSATDPFFTSSRPGQVDMQTMLGLKHELVARDAEGNDLAVASINLHRDHMGRAFDIASEGRPAHSSCLGLGLERWAYWILSHCGPEADDWPAVLRRSSGAEKGV